jgi:hypothetical protein
MTIRAAKFEDIPVIETMLHEMHAASKYRGRVEISDKAMRALLMGAVAGQNQNGPQASYARIAEQGGKPVGFMIGTLGRIYFIGDKLMAQDMFLYTRKGAEFGHTTALIDGYVAWAKSNRKVIEIVLSWNDTLPGAKRVAKVYERAGFRRNGEMFELRTDQGSDE